MRVLLIAIICMFGLTFGYSQKEYKNVRQGNQLYKDGKFKDAEISYRKALEKDPTSLKGSYNLANSLYKQDNYEEAANSYMASIAKGNNQNKEQQAATYHNLGNSMLKAEKYAEAIDAYKNALRLNPGDNDTRYNLSYALNKMQQNQQQQQSGDNKKDDRKQDDKQQQQSQSESGDQQHDDKQQQQKPQLSKKDAERMLQALNNDEKKTMDKVNKQKVKQAPVQVEKDW